MLTVNELTDFSEFEDLERIWNKGLNRAGDNNPFSTWEWLRCWWKHFGRGRELRILIAQEKDDVLGIAPFMLSRYKLLHFGKLKKIEFVGSPQSDYNNFILLRKERECVKIFLNHFMKFRDWDMLELRDIREASISANVLDELWNCRTSKLKFRVGTLCPYINLPTSIEHFLSRLSRNMRKNLRRRMQRLCEKYKVEFKTQNDFGSVKEAMKIFFDLHQKRWSSKGKPGSFRSQAFRDFHIDIARTFCEKGWLSLYLLTASDEPIAAIYSFDYNQKKYGYLTGFDPDFERYGVGNLLKMHAIEDCIRRGFKEYDLTRGFENYKMDWATGIRRNFVAGIVQKGFFARMYDWATRSSFSQFVVNQLGRGLALENS